MLPSTRTSQKDEQSKPVAKDSTGKKFNRIPAYDRVQDGKVIHVPAHVRSNPKTCRGEKK